MSKLNDMYRIRREVLDEIEAMENECIHDTERFRLMCLFRDMLTVTIREMVHHVIARNTSAPISDVCAELGDEVLSAEVIQ